MKKYKATVFWKIVQCLLLINGTVIGWIWNRWYGAIIATIIVLIYIVMIKRIAIYRLRKLKSA